MIMAMYIGSLPRNSTSWNSPSFESPHQIFLTDGQRTVSRNHQRPFFRHSFSLVLCATQVYLLTPFSFFISFTTRFNHFPGASQHSRLYNAPSFSTRFLGPVRYTCRKQKRYYEPLSRPLQWDNHTTQVAPRISCERDIVACHSN